MDGTTILFGWSAPVPEWFGLPAAALLGAGLGLTAGLLVQAVLRRAVKATPMALDDTLLEAFGPYLGWAGALAGLWAALLGMQLGPPARAQADRVLVVLLILLLLLAGMRLAGRLVNHHAGKHETLRPAANLIRRVVRVLVGILGGLMLLDAVGVSIGPLLTAFGLGSLAVALALQDTLSNFFAGLYLLADRPIRTGDYVRLDSTEEGFVESIGWRSTVLRTLDNTLVVVPNQKLAQASVRNYTLPEPPVSLLIRFDVGYDADPARVVTVVEDEARRAVGEVPGLLPEPAPFVRFIPGFGDSALQFTLIVRVTEFVAQYAVQSELRVRLLRRLRAEGIQIPYPQRVVHLRNEAESRK